MSGAKIMTIIGFCNPLLDITVSNNPSIRSLLSKYELKDNDIILADEMGRHDGLIEEMNDIGVEYSAGGAGLNSLRCAQLLLEKGTCRIVGSIGQDHYGNILIDKSLEVGLLTSFQTTSTNSSGKCACLIHGQDRSLVAYLGAANDFTANHLDTIKKEIYEADYLYITGFFYSVSPESVKRVIEYMNRERSRLIFNLSATFVPDMITREDFYLIMNNCDILIGNSDEFLHLTKKIQGTEDVEGFTLNVSSKYQNLTIIITQGSQAIKLIKGAEINLIPVPPIPTELIVDTNGAGDAFVGGILASLQQGNSLTKAIELGTFMASCVIKKSGINPPSIEEINEFINKNC